VQLLAQRYGSLPVAHRTGGLADTIEDGATGVLFEPLAPDALVEAAERGVAMLRRVGATALQKRLLAVDVSWRGPAERWERIFADVRREAARRI
jgi:starch synthase